MNMTYAKSIMKLQNASVSVAVLFSGLAAPLAHAGVNIETVYVGDAGNPNDSGNTNEPNTYGGVSYGYHVGTYEVTNTQYTDFLNAVAATDPHGLYNTNMATYTHGGITRSGSSGSYSYAVRSGRGNRPVNLVSFWDAARFANWLTTGDTETGVYVLGGVRQPTNSSITRNPTAWANGGVAITSENEWYKAAYYSGSPTAAVGDGYWLYPTQSNNITTADANYGGSVRGVNNLTAVGSYNRPSHYGTFDQGGNVWEWNETIVSSNLRRLRGGSFENDDRAVRASFLDFKVPALEDDNLGFRVSSLSLANLPEPSQFGGLMGVFALLMACFRRRRSSASENKSQ